MPSPTKSTDCTRARPRGAPQGLPCPRVAGASRLSMAGKWRWSPSPRVAGPSLRGMAPPRPAPQGIRRRASSRFFAPGWPCAACRAVRARKAARQTIRHTAPGRPHGFPVPPMPPRRMGGSATATPPMPAAPYAPLYAAPTPPLRRPAPRRIRRAGYVPDTRRGRPSKLSPAPSAARESPGARRGKLSPAFPSCPCQAGPLPHPEFYPEHQADSRTSGLPPPCPGSRLRSHAPPPFHAIPPCRAGLPPYPLQGIFFRMIGKRGLAYDAASGIGIAVFDFIYGIFCLTHNSIYGMFSSRHGAESPLPPHPRGVPETKGLPSTRLTVPAPPGLRQEGTLHARVGFRGRRPIFALRLPLHARARIGVAVCHSMPLISPPHARARIGPLGGHRSGPCARLCGTRHAKHAGGIHTGGMPRAGKTKGGGQLQSLAVRQDTPRKQGQEACPVNAPPDSEHGPAKAHRPPRSAERACAPPPRAYRV